VVVERFEEPEVVKPTAMTRISAVIYCERTGQKAILIGKGGTKLKSIGTGARKEIESLLGTRVYLELHVIVEENWRESGHFVDSLDWRKQLEDLAEAKPEGPTRSKPARAQSTRGR
jgi:GTP-binding protein Era